jgi:anti-sigma regulatory factor (Ser/Thr protein kinase)
MKEKILKEFQRSARLTTADLVSKLKVTRQAVHRHLLQLVREGKLLRLGSSRKTSYYVRNEPGSLQKNLREKGTVYRQTHDLAGLSEDVVLQSLSARPGWFVGMTDEARGAFRYAFTEMLNNAIDHSGSKTASVQAFQSPSLCGFTIQDRGVGAFENIRAKKGLTSELEAVQDLLKGKQTTQPEKHSGEGIFFSSKIADRFLLESHRKRLTVDNRIHDVFLEDIPFRKGTRVSFETDPRSKRKLEDLFHEYSGEGFRFDKSRVTVKLFEEGEDYVSRSQAKRLLHSLDRFREIILDFQGVKTVGQGFADEIFRVFASQYPEIRIAPVNANENVRFMIDRARA